MRFTATVASRAVIGNFTVPKGGSSVFLKRLQLPSQLRIYEDTAKRHRCNIDINCSLVSKVLKRVFNMEKVIVGAFSGNFAKSI